MRHLRRLAFTMLGLTASLSCGGGDSTGPAQPDPGPVTLTLASPNVNDGALVVAIRGGGVTSLQSPYEFSAASSGGVLTLILRGEITDGPIVTLDLPDRRQLGAYQAVVLQAAARGTYEQLTGAYELQILPR